MPGSVGSRHGKPDQEAPQAHAQEEAQEDAEAHPLPASGQGQVDLPAAYGRLVRVTTRSGPSKAPSTNQVEPLPARTGVRPVASPRRSRHSASRGSTTSAAGSRSFGPAAVGPPSSSHAR